jgi:hypothetical protein
MSFDLEEYTYICMVRLLLYQVVVDSTTVREEWIVVGWFVGWLVGWTEFIVYHV